MYRIFVLGFALTSGLTMATEIRANDDWGRWVREFTDQVHGVYVEASHYKSHQATPLSAILVRTNAVETQSVVGASLESLVSFQSGESVAAGCMSYRYELAESQVIRLGAHPCANVIRDALSRYAQEYERCEQYAKTNNVENTLFIDTRHDRAICLSTSGFVKSTEHNTKQNITVERVDFGKRAYLSLENNRIFNCQSYGRPIEYRAITTTLSTPKYERPWLVAKASQIWSYQYLIKTSGFTYCWGGTRMIDQPELGRGFLHLNDGTVLVAGNITVLRIRIADGTTEATHDTVRRLAVPDVYSYIDEHGGAECSGDYLLGCECPITTAVGQRCAKRGVPDDYITTVFYPAVVRGVDRLLQSLFRRELGD